MLKLHAFCKVDLAQINALNRSPQRDWRLKERTGSRQTMIHQRSKKNRWPVFRGGAPSFSFNLEKKLAPFRAPR